MRPQSIPDRRADFHLTLTLSEVSRSVRVPRAPRRVLACNYHVTAVVLREIRRCWDETWTAFADLAPNFCAFYNILLQNSIKWN